jgi:transcriptional regulator with XRE-family HTH domain
MTITPDQSRAARGLLNWTQDQLATNARIARATVAEFESNMRRPMKNNLLAIEDAMYAAGIEFIAENGTDGVGVRFRERKLQYSRNIKIHRNCFVIISMIWGGVDFDVVVPHEVLADHIGGQINTDDEYRVATAEFLHHILVAVERQMKLGFNGDRLVLESTMFDRMLQ